MYVTADRRLNPLLAIVLFGLAAVWTVSAIGAANYVQRSGAELDWLRKALHLPAAKPRPFHPEALPLA